MAKSGNAMNDAALESASGGAFGILSKDNSMVDLYKDDKTYLGTYGVNEAGQKAIDNTLSLYGNKDGFQSVRLFKDGEGPDKASQATGLEAMVKGFLNKNKNN